MSLAQKITGCISVIRKLSSKFNPYISKHSPRSSKIFHISGTECLLALEANLSFFYRKYMSEIEEHKRLFFCIVVDDEPLAQQVLENYIGRINELKLVAKCESVEEALTLLKLASVDIVFLDLDLKTIKGTELITKMQLFNECKYYIVITSAVSPEKNLPFDHGNNIVLIDYLTKPFSFEVFLKAILKIFEQIKT